jgi:DNA-binding CsgD family transcriptional regulator
MRHKFAALYGRSLAPQFFTPGLPIAFLNDAQAFALGEAAAGAGSAFRRWILVTLGTGVGSAFVAHGEIVTSGPGVPAGGEIWAERHLVTRTLQQALTAAGTDALLTSREREILGLLRVGHSNRQIADTLFISPETVKWHIRKVFSKIGAKDRLEATLYARDHNIFPRQERSERVVHNR